MNTTRRGFFAFVAGAAALAVLPFRRKTEGLILSVNCGDMPPTSCWAMYNSAGEILDWGEGAPSEEIFRQLNSPR